MSSENIALNSELLDQTTTNSLVSLDSELLIEDKFKLRPNDEAALSQPEKESQETGKGDHNLLNINSISNLNSLSANETSGEAPLPSTPIMEQSSVFNDQVDPCVNTRVSVRSYDPVYIERNNLMHVARLVIKDLIDYSMKHGRLITEENSSLQQLLIILEHILSHALKGKKTILHDKPEAWHVLELVEGQEAEQVTTSVRQMSHLKTPASRCRAWLRLALMQKKLADYFQNLIGKHDILAGDFYQKGAFMILDECSVLAGLLVGLQVIDCNLIIKDQDFSQQMGVINYSLFLNDMELVLDEETAKSSSDKPDSSMQSVLDQKNYLEELNRHLNVLVANLQLQVSTLKSSNKELKKETEVSGNLLEELRAEISKLTESHSAELSRHCSQMKNAIEDLKLERETFQTNQSGLDSMYIETQKRMQEEIAVRLEVERELQMQISMKQEMESAVRLLEKDIHEKQDTVIALRKQLEEIKGINLQLYNQKHESVLSLEHKTALVEKLEKKNEQMTLTLQEMEEQVQSLKEEKRKGDEDMLIMKEQMAKDKDAMHLLKSDLKIEREYHLMLQTQIDQDKTQSAMLDAEVIGLRALRIEVDRLQSEKDQLEAVNLQQGQALSEMGSDLGQSKLHIEDLKELREASKMAHWADDKLVTHCTLCYKEFSLSRRKHHCRHCGHIFCNDCSENKMPLASAAKAVRVCDTCYTTLIQSYSPETI